MKELQRLMAAAGITQWGVAGYEDLLPLLPVAAARRLPAEARSVIVCLLGYYLPAGARNVARFAVPDDYHQLAQKVLEPVRGGMQHAHPGYEFVFFIDNSPIPEVRAACLAGLGVRGRHGMLINPRYGSYAFICTLVTDLALPPSTPVPGGCGGCDRCLAACPGGALTADGFDKQKCLSFLTQKKGALSSAEAAAIRAGGFVWGCDRCAEACPGNNGLAPTDIPVFVENLDWIVTRENIPALLPRKAYGYRGEAVLLRNLELTESNGEEPNP